jgi:hypothetical protein
LIFDRNETETALTLLRAYQNANPHPLEAAPAYAFLLHHYSAQVRLTAANALAGLQPLLQEVDLAPLLFSAWKKEHHEETRGALRRCLDGYLLHRLRGLESLYEGLRFSVGAKRADLRDRSLKHELAPDQFDRALIIVHLDQSGEAKHAASTALFRCANRLTPEQRNTLTVSIVYALSDPQIFNEYVLSDLLYTAEQLGPQTISSALPAIRLLYEDENPRTRADAALVGMCLGDLDPSLVETATKAITDKGFLAAYAEDLAPDPAEVPLLTDSLDEIYLWAKSISPTGDDPFQMQTFLEEFRNRYLGACHDILNSFNARVELVCKRLREKELRSDDLSRELFTLRASARVSKLPTSTIGPLMAALLHLVQDPQEDPKMRSAVLSRLAWGDGISRTEQAPRREISSDRNQSSKS